LYIHMPELAQMQDYVGTDTLVGTDRREISSLLIHAQVSVECLPTMT